MTMKTPCKVHPIRQGLDGFTAQGGPIVLQPGMPGWMDMEDALLAEKAGDVQIMAGQTPQSLRAPEYGVRAMSAAIPPDLDSTVDEDPPVQVEAPKAEVPPAPPPAKPNRTPPKPGAKPPRRRYKRTDMKPEN